MADEAKPKFYVNRWATRRIRILGVSFHREEVQRALRLAGLKLRGTAGESAGHGAAV
jgi:hypothetical protein